MADINQTAADLLGVLESGLINEDLMSEIMNVDDQSLEFTNRIGSGSHSAPSFDWVMDRYKAQDTDNAFVDGQDVDLKDNSEGQRVSNFTQTSVKGVKTSTRADAVDVVGRANTLSYQVQKVATELRRDVEGIMLSNQAPVEDDGNTTAGRMAGLECWIDGKTLIPAETGAITYTQTAAVQNVAGTGAAVGGGWDNRTGKLIANWTYTDVIPGALTETSIKDAMLALYKNTGSRANRILMMSPEVNSLVNDFYFTDGAKVATLTAETNQKGPATAMGAVNTILGPYGLLDMTPNNLLPPSALAAAIAGTEDSHTAFILDMSQIEQSFLYGYRSEPLAKQGLSRRSMIHVDYSLKVKNSEALGAIRGVSPSTAMVA